MFEFVATVVLDEDPDTTSDPRHALIVRDPPTPCEVEVAAWLLDRKPRWWERPFWLRSSGIFNHPVPGLLHAWVLTASNDRFGIVDVSLTSSRGQLRLTLPAQLIPAYALRPASGKSPG